MTTIAPSCWPGSNAPSSPSPCGTTTDVGIAAFYCLITDRRHEHAHSGAGAGAHPARAVALLRALTEAIQVRTTYITGSRDDLRPDEFRPRRSRTSCAGAGADERGRGAAELSRCADLRLAHLRRGSRLDAGPPARRRHWGSHGGRSDPTGDRRPRRTRGDPRARGAGRSRPVRPGSRVLELRGGPR